MSDILFVRGKSFQRAIVRGYKNIKRGIVLNVTLSYLAEEKNDKGEGCLRRQGVW